MWDFSFVKMKQKLLQFTENSYKFHQFSLERYGMKTEILQIYIIEM